MDAHRDAHYIATWMNLLLLLSALLSAITGVNVGGARVPVAAEQVVRAGQVADVVVANGVLTERHAPGFDQADARLAAVPLVSLPVLAVPAYASRRRE